MIKPKNILFVGIQDIIKSLDIGSITKDRKVVLQALVKFIQSKVEKNQEIRINFICTHNSRRSHFAQVWSQTLAYYFNIKNLSSYSAGTESTALFPMVVETLKNSGFEVENLSEGNNPIYSIKYAENESPIIGFSKKIDDNFNPKSEFAAIMTCSEADLACPFIGGAEKRISINYEDPKIFDNQPQRAEKYNERSLQIATELYYIFAQIKS